MLKHLLNLENIMAKPLNDVHNEIVGTSWLLNGFLLLSVAWLMGTMWASSGTNTSGTTTQTASVLIL